MSRERQRPSGKRMPGYSRFIVHWDLCAQRTGLDVECILQAVREKFPTACPRIISDNGPQFVANDFKVFICLCGMTYVRTAPYYPQSSIIERWHQSIKSEAICVANPSDEAEARRMITRYVEEHNERRLQSAIAPHHAARQATRLSAPDLGAA